jgi:uncharacterized membrane protein
LTAVRALDGLLVAAVVLLLGCLAFWWIRPEGVLIVVLGLAGLRAWLATPAWAIPGGSRAVALGAVAYAALFSFITLTRHHGLDTHALDLGYYVQLVWHLATGRGPHVSLPEMHAWGDHLSPIMYAFVPAFWVAPGAPVLLVLQSIILALGALPVFVLARRRLGDPRLGAAFALLYLANPSLHGINVRDFHAAALAIPLLLLALERADAGRPVVAGLAMALTLACREDAAIAVAGVGLWLALARRRWIAGAVVAALALAVLAADVRWIIPYFREEPYSHLGRYAHLGSSLGGIMAQTLLHPLSTLAGVMTQDRLKYLLAMLAPLALLPLAAPLQAVGALPALAQNLLSSDPVLFHHRTPYQSFVLPFLMVGAIEGWARLRGRLSPRAGATLVGVALLASGTLSARTIIHLAVPRFWPTPADRAAHRLLAQVPREPAVSAQDPYVPHLALRPQVFVFPVGLEACDLVVLNEASYPWRNLPGARMSRDGAALLIAVDGQEYHYRVLAQEGTHLLARRTR